MRHFRAVATRVSGDSAGVHKELPTLSGSKTILEGTSYAIGVIDGAPDVCGVPDHCVEALCASTCTAGQLFEHSSQAVNTPYRHHVPSNAHFAQKEL